MTPLPTPLSRVEPRRILLVEDNAGDVRLLREAFRRSPQPPEIQVAADGVEALRLLRAGRDARPDLILLDLNLPRMDGRELLGILKTDAQLRRIPVVALTSSSADADVRRVYELNANGYLVKPDTFDGLVDLVGLIEHYWFGATRLPD